jgi:hypothetical protein
MRVSLLVSSIAVLAACAAPTPPAQPNKQGMPEFRINSEYEFVGKDASGKEFRRTKLFLANNEAHLYAMAGLCLNQQVKSITVLQGGSAIGEVECTQVVRRG